MVLTSLLAVSTYLASKAAKDKALETIKGIAEKKAEELSGKSMLAIWQNVKNYKNRWRYTDDDELLKAVSKAYWDATELLLHDYRSQYTIGDSDGLLINKLQGWIKEEKKLSVEGAKEDILSDNVSTLLAKGSQASEYIESLDKLLTEDLENNIKHIIGEGQLPDLIQMLRQGWQREGNHVSWLQVLIFKFVEKLKGDDSLLKLFSERTMSNISVDIQELKLRTAEILRTLQSLYLIEESFSNIQSTNALLVSKIDLLLANQPQSAKNTFFNSSEAIQLVDTVDTLKISVREKYLKFEKRQQQATADNSNEDTKELLAVAEAAWQKEIFELRVAEERLAMIRDFVISAHQFFERMHKADMSESIKAAEQLFMAGNFNAVINLLENPGRAARQQNMREREQTLKNEKQNFARESLLLAQTILLQFDNVNRHQAAVQYFEESIESFPFFDNYYEYGSYKYRQNQKGEAIKLYTKAIELAEEKTADVIVGVYNKLGLLHNDRNEFEQAAGCFEQALEVSNQILKKEGNLDLVELINLLNSLGGYYSTIKQPERAQHYFSQALAIVNDWSGDKLERLIAYKALTYKNVGIYYNLFSDTRNAIAYLENAKEYFKQAIKVDDCYEPPYSECLNQLSRIYHSRNNSLARENIEEALAIARRLYSEDPACKPDLASDLQQLGHLIVDESPDESKIYFDEALKLVSELCENGETAYKSQLGSIYNHLGIYSIIKKNPQQALIYYSKALTIYKELFDIDFKANGELVSGVFFNIGLLYLDAFGNIREAIMNIEAAVRINRRLYTVIPESVAFQFYESLIELAKILKPIDINASIQLSQEAAEIERIFAPRNT